MRRKIIPEGTRDLVGEECIVKSRLVNNLGNLFKGWGYEEVITPTIEYYETFNSDVETLREEDMYKFLDNKGKILVLRPDMTIPIARLVATKMKDIKLPLRLTYTSNIFRVHESLGGKRNEYTDCGIELIGLSDLESDLEVITTAIEALKALEIKDFKLEIGNINIFNSAVKYLNLEEDSKSKLAELINSKSLKELEDFLNKLNIEEEYKALFTKLPWLFGSGEIFDRYDEIAINDGIKNALNYLKILYSKIVELGYDKYITFDFGMVPRLNYYTGIIFRGFVQGVGNKVLSGGRYDKLISRFGINLQAVGFSVNVDIVAESKCEENTNSKCTIIYYSKEKEVSAIKKSIELRANGEVVKLIPVEGNLLEGILVEER